MTDIRSDRGPELLNREEISSLVGDLCDTDIAAIVSLQPSRAELEAALAWAELESYVVGEARRPLNGKIAEIYEILNPRGSLQWLKRGKRLLYRSTMYGQRRRDGTLRWKFRTRIT
jgi:hypothetical protein